MPFKEAGGQDTGSENKQQHIQGVLGLNRFKLTYDSSSGFDALHLNVPEMNKFDLI
jgi:hypothetical protein